MIDYTACIIPCHRLHQHLVRAATTTPLHTNTRGAASLAAALLQIWPGSCHWAAPGRLSPWPRPSHPAVSCSGSQARLRSEQATEKDSCLSLTVVRETERELRSCSTKRRVAARMNQLSSSALDLRPGVGRCEVSGHNCFIRSHPHF